TCYFFREYGYHLHLHSFPTRRSSDLPRCEAEVPLTPYAADGLSAPFQAAFAPGGPAIRRCSYREGVHCAGRCFIPVGAAPPLRTGRAFDSYAEDGLSAPFQAAFAPGGPAIRRRSYRGSVHCAGRCFIPVGAAPPLRSRGAFDSYAADGLSAPLQAAFAPSGPAIRRRSYRGSVHCAG